MVQEAQPIVSKESSGYRERMGLRKDEFFGLTYISGQINGQRFKGQGTGRLNLVEGYSVNDIELEDFPETFSPVMCASWSCKKHKTTGTGLVIKAYKQELTIEYTKGAQGLIYTVGDVRNMDLGASLCYNSFEGDYQGPTKAIKVHPFTVNYRRMSANRYHVSATRTVETDSGLVEANWNGISTILSDELPNNFAVELTMKDFSWENRNGKGHYYKLLALRSLHL